MAKVWHIEGRSGSTVIFERDLPGNMSEREIEATLQRLVARHLSADEVVSASLRKNARDYSRLLERVGRGTPICYGENPHYIADSRVVS